MVKATEVYGDLFQNTHFVNTFSYWLKKLYTIGVEKTISEYLEN